MLIHLAVDRMIDMENRAFVLMRKIGQCLQAGLDGINVRILLNDLRRSLHHDLLGQRRDIGKMIVECIAVDAAFFNDHFDGYLCERHALKQ